MNFMSQMVVVKHRKIYNIFPFLCEKYSSTFLLFFFSIMLHGLIFLRLNIFSVLQLGS